MKLIDADALCEYALNQKDHSVDPNDIMRFPRVEAIPIEWIQQYLKNRPFAMAYGMVKDWHDEQRKEE